MTQTDPYQQDNPILSDTTIKRKLFKFFRHHKIHFKQDSGMFYLGSAKCTVTDGRINCYFPQIAKHYSTHMWFSVDFDDCWNTYLNISRKHNKLLAGFPLALDRYLPDLFD